MLLATSGLATAWRGARHVVRVPVRAPPRPRLGVFGASIMALEPCVCPAEAGGAHQSLPRNVSRGELGRRTVFVHLPRSPDRRPCTLREASPPTIKVTHPLDFPCYVAAAGLVGCGVASLTQPMWYVPRPLVSVVRLEKPKVEFSHPYDKKPWWWRLWFISKRLTYLTLLWIPCGQLLSCRTSLVIQTFGRDISDLLRTLEGRMLFPKVRSVDVNARTFFPATS